LICVVEEEFEGMNEEEDWERKKKTRGGRYKCD